MKVTMEWADGLYKRARAALVDYDTSAEDGFEDFKTLARLAERLANVLDEILEAPLVEEN